ncbi:MAG: chemotaxis protein CheX [Pirellulaceae bacterium]|nr:chemotaxis protein CheX [Pirellulaceae bacterium]
MLTVSDKLADEVLARIHRKSQRRMIVHVNDAATENQQRIIDALTHSTLGLFETMCGWQMTRTSVEYSPVNRIGRDLTGIISISGNLKATVVVGLSENLAFSVADAFLGSRPTGVDADVIDLAGELTNMICGNAKERLAVEGLVLGLPTVVAGSSRVAFESGLKIAQIGFECEHGALSITMGMCE